MTVWVDADACPRAIRDIIVRAAQRREIETIFVANHYIPLQKSRYISSMSVPQGFDKADKLIEERSVKNDLVITADVPLAAAVVENDAVAINPRGKEYDKENIKGLLANRDLSEELRSQGNISSGPPAINQTNIRDFSNSLDRYITKFKSGT